MDQSSKGLELNIKIVLAAAFFLILGALAAPAILGAVEDSEERIDSGLNNTAPKVNESTCIADCRQDFPGGGAEYAACKSDC